MVPSVRSPSSQLVDVVRVRDQVNNLAQALLPSRTPVFGAVSLPLPDVDGGAELAFIRAESWLYVHYFEVGRVSVRFLVRRNATGAARGLGHEHLDLVHALRTWSQHSIDPTSKHDAAIAEVCESWFERMCGTRLPRTNEHWMTLVHALLDDAYVFLTLLLDLLAAIEGDDDRDVICRQWEDRLKRDWPAHRHHELIAIAATDLGRGALDPVAFYDRHGHVIREGLRLLSEDCNFEEEARKLIERAMLTETAAVLPITGRDVMDVFDISPGPQVGHLLERARRMYEEQPCSREALLLRLRDVDDGPGHHV